jgi:hypothetical protein
MTEYLSNRRYESGHCARAPVVSRDGRIAIRSTALGGAVYAMGATADRMLACLADVNVWTNPPMG